MYDLNKLKEITDQIIAEMKPSDFPYEAINWGDIHCHDAEHVINSYGCDFYRVYIEEASPDCTDFCTYIERELIKRGFERVYAHTEW